MKYIGIKTLEELIKKGEAIKLLVRFSGSKDIPDDNKDDIDEALEDAWENFERQKQYLSDEEQDLMDEQLDWTLQLLSDDELDWLNNIYDRGYILQEEEKRWNSLLSRFPDKFDELHNEQLERLIDARPETTIQ